MSKHPVASGGFSEVWEGIYNDKRVAIKTLHVSNSSNVQEIKKVAHLTFLTLLDTCD